MLDHPFLTTLALSIILSFSKVLFVDRSIIAFCAHFLSFPYWAVILIYLSFYILRNVRNSRAYRLLHTIYHEDRGSTTRPHLNFTNQPDEFGLTT